MTITQLKYTLAVAEYGNFTTASEKCFVTQPTLSMQVQKLEEELGVTIFNRSTKPLQVTEIGNKVLIQARKIVEDAKPVDFFETPKSEHTRLFLSKILQH